METANWLVGETTNLFGSLLWNFLSSGILYGLLGLVVGIALVIIGEKRGYFRRSNNLWTVLAKLNWIYLPILLAVCFCTFGTIRAVQSSLNEWIDESSDMLQTYSIAYIPQIEDMGQQMLASASQNEEFLEETILKSAGVLDNQLAQEFYTWVNKGILSYTAESLGYDDDIQGFQSMIEDGKLQQLNTTSFDNMAGFLQGHLSSDFMLPTYWWLFMLLLPFIAIPLIEWGIHFMYNRLKQA